MMTSNEFVKTLKHIADDCKTMYILGCFGAPMSDKNKIRYTSNYPENGKEIDVVKGRDAYGKPIVIKERTKEGAERYKKIMGASVDTFGYDCVCLGKGILWGWNGDVTRTYGGANYACNNVPDVSANGMITKLCYDVTSDFSSIVPGEVVWMNGHVGYYVGDGKVVECTSRWESKVLYSNLGNLGFKTDHWRNWTKHGKLKVVDYSNTVSTPVSKPAPTETNDIGKRKYKVQKGDTLIKIAKAYNTTVEKIVADNIKNHKGLTNPNLIVTGWILYV